MQELTTRSAIRIEAVGLRDMPHNAAAVNSQLDTDFSGFPAMLVLLQHDAAWFALLSRMRWVSDIVLTPFKVASR